MALNVLVVDDSSIMRAMTIKALRVSGLPLGEVHEAANGQEALRVIEEKRIDVALVDINMPVMNGEELVDRLRENPETQNLPVIVVSSESSEKRVELLRSKGTEFMRKPFTPEILREVIARMTGLSEEQQPGAGNTPVGGPVP